MPGELCPWLKTRSPPRPSPAGAPQPLQPGSRGVEAGRAVPLDEDEVAAVVLAGGVPEVHEAGVVEGRRRLEAGDVAAQLRALLAGAARGRARSRGGGGAA